MLPDVTVLMPFGVGRFAKMALSCFLSQTYKGRLELVLVDNSDDDELLFGVSQLSEADRKRVSYLSYPKCITNKPIGTLRNIGNGQAWGDIIVHFDSDDFQHPNRVSYQVARLLETGKAVSGFHSSLYWNESTGGVFRYHYSPDREHEPY